MTDLEYYTSDELQQQEDDRASAEWAHQQTLLDLQEVTERLTAVRDELERTTRDPMLSAMHAALLTDIAAIASACAVATASSPPSSSGDRHITAA